MADTALKLVLLGDDRTASKALRGVGREAGQAHGKLDKLKGGAKVAGAAIAGGLLVAGAAAVSFGADSLAAFADADKSQKQLEDAYRRFPKVQDVTIESLRRYNEALQRKGYADADDIASGQAVMAQFKLTGEQIRQATPLVVDWANKTGKDLPGASKTFGKALMGNTRALKDLGIDYKSTGDRGKDFANITKLLEERVGGFSASLPEAEKKQRALQASFGDLQEEVGERLQPAMLGLVDAGQGVLDWLDQNPAVMEGVTAAAGLLGDGLKGIWFVISKFVAPAIAWFLKMQVATINGFADLTEAANNSPLGALVPDDAADKIRAVGEGLWDVANGLESLSKEPKVDTGAEVAKAQVKGLNAEIRGLRGKVVEAKSKGDTKEVDRLRDKIAKLKDKKVDVQANVRKTGINGIRIRDIAHGNIKISAYASGIASAPGGLAWAGESGPELLQIPTGTRVLSNGQSRAMVNQARTGGGGPRTIVQASFTTRPAPPLEFAKWMQAELNKLRKAQGGKFSWDK